MDIFGVIMPDGSKHDLGDRYVRGLLNGLGEGESGAVIGATDYVTPQMYGAAGDGETDDYEAFAKMFAETPENVYIPAGRYYISAPLTISNGIHTIKGAGVGVTGILCDNGFIDSGSSVVYRLHMSDIGLTCKTKDNIGIAINGKYSYCTFSRILADYFEKAFFSSGNSWIDLFDRCEFNNNTYAIYSSEDHLNNITFRNCAMQYNEYAYYNEKTGSNVLFSGCDIELNAIAFHTKDQRAFVVRDSYLENNEKLFEIFTACYGADWTLENNFIYSKTSANGWLIDLPTSDTQNVPSGAFNIEKCYMRHENGNYTPFVFHDSYEYSQVSVNIHGCRFYQRPDTYFDLFDITNCPNYGNAWNRLPIDTDLVYYATDTCKWYIHSGNNYDGMRKDTRFVMYGYLVPDNANSKNSVASVPISAKVGKIENAILGGCGMLLSEKDASDALSGVMKPALLLSVTEGGLRFALTEYGSQDYSDVPTESLVSIGANAKIYVNGLAY